jgi:DNA (cytosine-5)-methyltransferase 1
MTAYHNESNGYCAQWLVNLIHAQVLPPGEVDCRDIREVQPADLRGFTQCHFFAGIGIWPYALRRAGWPDSQPVWTGSCPCQPWSSAGQLKGTNDDRHLWPEFFRLIRECKPGAILGEQVASKSGLGWFDLVSADLEGEAYAVAAADTCAAGVGAPHIRQRLYWCALAHTMQPGRAEGRARAGHGQVAGGSDPCKLGNPSRTGLEGRAGVPECGNKCAAGAPSLAGFWQSADWLHCRDAKWRPVEPGTFPLVDGVTNRVEQLRAYGNALCAPQALAFVQAVMECAP